MKKKVVSYYKETLEKKIEWTFRLQSTLLTVASATFAVLCFFKQSFNQQRLQSNFTIGGNMFKRTIHPFSCITIYENRAMSNVMIRNAQKTGRRIYPL